MNFKVNQINKVDYLDFTPARVNRQTGQVYLNSRIWDSLSPEIQTFILLHEEGHYQLQTKDELQADNYASKRFLGSQPFSLKKSIEALEHFLKQGTEFQKKRILNQYLRALLYDYVVFGNIEAKKNFYRLKLKNYAN